MAKLKPVVTDQQWIRLEPLRPKPKPSPKDGRKPRGNREVFDGIIWVWPSGARWNDLTDRYTAASTCGPRLQQWEEQGVWLKIWPKSLSELDQQGQLDWEETFTDGTKRGPGVEETKGGKGTKWMVVVDSYRC